MGHWKILTSALSEARSYCRVMNGGQTTLALWFRKMALGEICKLVYIRAGWE